MDASRYLAGSVSVHKYKKSRIHKRQNVHRIWEMSVRKVRKDKKKSAVIILSLAMGLLVFLCVITLLESQGPRTIVSSVWADDMEIPYEKEVQEYKVHPEKFATVLVGLDEKNFQTLNESLNEPVDEDAFLKGESCILYLNGLQFENKDLVGKTLTAAKYKNATHTFSFSIAGLPVTYALYESMNYMAIPFLLP